MEATTETLLKVKPKTYNEHSCEFDKFTEEEYSNVSSDNTVSSAYSNGWAEQTELIENTIDEAEQFPYIRRRLTGQSQKETCLIAQDVWYDAPELRHVIALPSDATPAEDTPIGVDDPKKSRTATAAQAGARIQRPLLTLSSYQCSLNPTSSRTNESSITTLKSLWRTPNYCLTTLLLRRSWCIVRS